MQDRNREKYKEIYNSMNVDIKINKLNNSIYIGGFFSYIITKSGANKIIKYINENSIKHGIDYLIKIIPELNCYETQPQLIFSDWVKNSNSLVDSDIQKNYEVFDFNKFTNINNSDWIFCHGLDYINDDLCYVGNKSLEELLLAANEKDDCVAFNTLGFLKKNFDIARLQKSQYFSDKDGIYLNFVKLKQKLLSIIKPNNEYNQNKKKE
jgi:hypothetical protein